MSRWNMGWILGVAITAIVGLSLTYSAPTRDEQMRRKHENLKLLVDVLDEVQNKYVKELDADKMRDLVENMITLGLERLDPHSSFLNKEEFTQFNKQNKGRFGGIGIRIGVERGQVFVETPMVGTPAYEAGVLAGDIILKIDDMPTEGMPLKKVVESIQGEPGTKVKLTVLHEAAKATSDIEITRAEIAVDSVMGDRRQPNNLKEWDFWVDPDTKIAYVRVTAFTEKTTEELTKVVAALQKAGMAGLVVDLRNNPGGLLRSAVEVSSLFLPEGKTVVTTKERDGKKENVFTSRSVSPSVDNTKSYPLVILLNRYSASASEIVAAALQDHFRAIIIGERSFGKGSVQNIIPVEGNTSAVKLTTASYWRPSNKNIHRFPESKEEDEWGVRPNKGYEVKLTDEERVEYFKGRRERDIVRRPDQPAKEKDGEKRVEFKDKMLEKAVEYIKGELAKNGNARVDPAPDVQPGERHRAPVVADAIDDRAARVAIRRD